MDKASPVSCKHRRNAYSTEPTPSHQTPHHPSSRRPLRNSSRFFSRPSPPNTTAPTPPAILTNDTPLSLPQTTNGHEKTHPPTTNGHEKTHPRTTNGHDENHHRPRNVKLSNVPPAVVVSLSSASPHRFPRSPSVRPRNLFSLSSSRPGRSSGLPQQPRIGPPASPPGAAALHRFSFPRSSPRGRQRGLGFGGPARPSAAGCCGDSTPRDAPLPRSRCPCSSLLLSLLNKAALSHATCQVAPAARAIGLRQAPGSATLQVAQPLGSPPLRGPPQGVPPQSLLCVAGLPSAPQLETGPRPGARRSPNCPSRASLPSRGSPRC